MGWYVEVAMNSAGAGATSWPTHTALVETGTPLGFFGDNSGGPVTVGEWQSESALIYSTSVPTITQYFNNCRYITDTGFAVSTPSGADYYYEKTTNQYTTPQPAYGVSFRFSTSGQVNFTQASAWYGVVSGGAVIGTSADAGFACAIAEFTTTEAWTRARESGRKKDLNTTDSYRQRLHAANPTNAATAHWFIGLSLSPKSAGAKQGAFAIDITYS